VYVLSSEVQDGMRSEKNVRSLTSEQEPDAVCIHFCSEVPDDITCYGVRACSAFHPFLWSIKPDLSLPFLQSTPLEFILTQV
jgi:hypothetical protein